MTPTATPDHGDRVTRPTGDDVDAVLAAVTLERRRDDARAVLTLMREVTAVEPVLWGSSVIGFGRQPVLRELIEVSWSESSAGEAGTAGS